MLYKHEKELIQHQLDGEEKVLKELEREYAAALKQINARIRLLKSDVLTQSKIYRIQYQEALKAQVEAILEKLHADEYSTIQQYLSDSYTDGFVGTIYSMHKQGVPLVLPIDKNAAAKAVVTDSKIKGSLYEALGIDVDAMKKSISQELTRGISSGLSFDDIARNIKHKIKAPLANIKRIVRTEGHRIQETSTDDARREAKKKGANVVKQWDAILDGVTRPTHQQLDGQIRETDDYFEVAGKRAKYPGAFGDPAEDCNCRCVALTRARLALDEDELEELKARAKYFGLDKTKDFEDFKEKYLKAAEAEVKEAEPLRIETRKQAVEAIENGGFRLVGHGVEYMPDDQVIVAAERLYELEARFGCAKDGNYTLEAPVLAGKDKKTHAYVRTNKTAGNNLVLNAQYYSKSVETFAKKVKQQIASGYSMPCADNNIKHYIITHEYGHMFEFMMYKKRNGVSLADLDSKQRKATFAKFEKDVWFEIVGIAKEKNPDFKVTKSALSEYGRTNYAEAFAETFTNALCGEPNALGDAMNVWLERNGF